MQEAAITPKVRRTKRIAWGYRKLNAWKKRLKKLERQASKKETPRPAGAGASGTKCRKKVETRNCNCQWRGPGKRLE